MAIVQTYDFYDVQAAFERFNRQDDFSREGLRVLFDYLEDVSDNINQPIVPDVIAWCCNYTEDTIDGIIQNYNLEDDVDGMDDDGKKDYVREYLEDNTCLCGETSEGFVYQVF